ncbi:T-cell activation Rho GTPase-activating protein [Pelobates fuscus]|uniref:T-cell activation Rho GTPase-activating protein n=1 Tax=Pelobates fuscus TaxID=191477 RepID=UPI002FE43F3F
MSAPHPRSKTRRGSYDGILPNKNSLHKSLAQRRCSAPSLVFPKTLIKPWSTGRDNTGISIAIEQCPFVLGLSNEDSELILHECVQLTQNLKTTERYLFLFSDMIIIAKLKSGTSFRMKHRVDLSEMIALSCDEDDEEEACAFHITPKNALIFIWPYNGCIATFRCREVKELWLDTLIWQIKEVGGIEGNKVPSARLLMKVLTGCNASKALNANNMETLIECHSMENVKKYQLLAAMINEAGICHANENTKKRKAVISWPFTFRRSSTLSESSSPSELNTTLFDQPLSIVCEDDTLPKPILDILKILRVEGPLAEGIFRKAANEKARKELKEELNYGKTLDLKYKSVHLLAVVLKDFLRGIPHQLLSSDLYDEWMAALEKTSLSEKIEAMKCVADKLPRPNFILLQHLICVLHHISKASDVNKMDSNNLAVCIGPNMLIPNNDKSLPLETQKRLNEKVISLVEFLIDRCFEMFGDNVSQLLSASEEDSLENIDIAEISSHQNDSAYDSTDQDHEGLASPFRRRLCWHNTFGSEDLQSSVDQDLELSPSSVTRLKNLDTSIDRRCSEPYIFPSQGAKVLPGAKLTRSHDDVTVRKRGTYPSDGELSKQGSEECCSRALYKKKIPKGLSINTSAHLECLDDLLPNVTSTYPLDNSYLDCSVFTSSPLVSPSSPEKTSKLKHQSFSTKCKDKIDAMRPAREIRKHSNSFSYVNHKKCLSKTQSWGPEGQNTGLHRNALTLSLRNKRQPDSPRDKQFQQPPVVRLRRTASARKMSVDEVFRIVDQRNPGNPPSYEEAVNKNSCSFESMTVHTMRSSVSSKDLLSEHENESSHKDSTDHIGSNSIKEVQTGDAPFKNDVEKTIAVRTLSESSQPNKHDCLSRRCSQPVFEIYDQLQYAKESYV